MTGEDQRRSDPIREDQIRREVFDTVYPSRGGPDWTGPDRTPAAVSPAPLPVDLKPDLNRKPPIRTADGHEVRDFILKGEQKFLKSTGKTADFSFLDFLLYFANELAGGTKSPVEELKRLTD